MWTEERRMRKAVAMAAHAEYLNRKAMLRADGRHRKIIRDLQHMVHLDRKGFANEDRLGQQWRRYDAVQRRCIQQIRSVLIRVQRSAMRHDLRQKTRVRQYMERRIRAQNA